MRLASAAHRPVTRRGKNVSFSPLRTAGDPTDCGRSFRIFFVKQIQTKTASPSAAEQAASDSTASAIPGLLELRVFHHANVRAAPNRMQTNCGRYRMETNCGRYRMQTNCGSYWMQTNCGC